MATVSVMSELTDSTKVSQEWPFSDYDAEVFGSACTECASLALLLLFLFFCSVIFITQTVLTVLGGGEKGEEGRE